MFDPILATMATHTSSATLWQALERQFSNQSCARLLQIKSQLQCSSKNNTSISDYCDQIKNLADQLAIIGDPLSDFDLGLYLLHGLGPEHDSVVTSITSRSGLLSFDEVQSLLMAHKSHLECHLAISDLSMKLQENFDFCPNSRPFFPSHNFGFFGSSIYGSSNNNISGRGSGSFRKFLFGRGNPTLKLICQVCTRVGHSAAVCHYHFDRSFQTPTSPSAAYFCDLDGSIVDYEPSAFMADTCLDFGVFEPVVWYADTSASHHIVSNSEENISCPSLFWY